jgi:hypothetical protein
MDFPAEGEKCITGCTRFSRDQGSLIAGVLALIAGIIAYRAGVTQAKATTDAADREITAIKESISAAQEQTRVAQEQIAVTLQLERRRIAKETYAFLATLKAAMGTVLEDVQAAREIFGKESQAGSSGMAYTARQRIKKTAFEDLRSGCLRLGDQLTEPFLHLDNEIDVFAGKWHTRTGTVGGEIPIGINTGLLDELDDMQKHAASLREKAADGMRRCTAIVAETQSPDFP